LAVWVAAAVEADLSHKPGEPPTQDLGTAAGLVQHLEQSQAVAVAGRERLVRLVRLATAETERLTASRDLASLALAVVEAAVETVRKVRVARAAVEQVDRITRSIPQQGQPILAVVEVAVETRQATCSPMARLVVQVS